LSVHQLRSLISYKKQKTDKGLQLKNQAQLLEVWEQIKDRPVIPQESPTITEDNGEENNEDEN
jgi:hypothetical protein